MLNNGATALPYDLVVVNGLVVLEDRIEKVEIGVRDGRIAEIGASLERSGARVIDAAGLAVLPGMIDAHVHFNEPGFGHWEGYATGSNALAAGGCTTFIDMPLNGVPPTVTVAALEQKRRRARGVSLVDYGFWGGLMPGYLEQLPLLAKAGVVGFKAFMSSPGDEHEEAFRRSDDGTLLEGMKRIAELGKVLVLHAEDEDIVTRLSKLALSEGRRGAFDYSASRPIEAELEAVSKALDYARQAGCSLHFAHISSEAAVKVIWQARRTGQDVTLETCPHYLTLTEDDFAHLGAVAKCAPPLRSAAEQARLWQCLELGLIDLIASDHSPCPAGLKEHTDMFAAWGGISGAQSSLELLVDEGYLKRGIPLTQISQLLSGAPARRFGLHHRKGAIQVGHDADLVLVDLNGGYRLTADRLFQRHMQTPYMDRELGCKVRMTLLRGKAVYEEGLGTNQSRAGLECFLPRKKEKSNAL
ncbi:allantoinase AllB [Paenibacillus sp. YIM B09110]|uniref:allantoinase AllB n=1 Tax=Paenibacillus sp. YIM B09110 TaxID=3126102 RepID=UPI00301D29C7